MKAFLFLVLVAFALSAPTVEESQKNSIIDFSAIEEIIECLVEKSAPVQDDIADLVDAVLTYDIAKAITLVQKIYAEGKVVFTECFAEKVPKVYGNFRKIFQ